MDTRRSLVKSSFPRETRMHIYRSSARPDSSSQSRVVSVGSRTPAHAYRIGHSAQGGSFRVQIAGRSIEMTGVSAGATRRASEIGQPTKRKARNAEAWLASHPREVRRQKGRWIAVNRDGIVATSKSFDHVFKLAAKGGERDPLVFKVPSSTEKRIVSARR